MTRFVLLTAVSTSFLGCQQKGPTSQTNPEKPTKTRCPPSNTLAWPEHVRTRKELLKLGTTPGTRWTELSHRNVQVAVALEEMPVDSATPRFNVYGYLYHSFYKEWRQFFSVKLSVGEVKVQHDKAARKLLVLGASAANVDPESIPGVLKGKTIFSFDLRAIGF